MAAETLTAKKKRLKSDINKLNTIIRRPQAKILGASDDPMEPRLPASMCLH